MDMKKELAKIQNMIYEIRGFRVMLDSDLAQMYGVEAKVLNQAVKRNISRFPADFMFQLTKVEKKRWSQIVTTIKKTELRRLLMLHIENTDNKLSEHDKTINKIIQVLNNLIERPETKKIGFNINNFTLLLLRSFFHIFCIYSIYFYIRNISKI